MRNWGGAQRWVGGRGGRPGWARGEQVPVRCCCRRSGAGGWCDACARGADAWATQEWVGARGQCACDWGGRRGGRCQAARGRVGGPRPFGLSAGLAHPRALLTGRRRPRV